MESLSGSASDILYTELQRLWTQRPRTSPRRCRFIALQKSGRGLPNQIPWTLMEGLNHHHAACMKRKGAWTTTKEDESTSWLAVDGEETETRSESGAAKLGLHTRTARTFLFENPPLRRVSWTIVVCWGSWVVW